MTLLDASGFDLEHCGGASDFVAGGRVANDQPFATCSDDHIKQPVKVRGGFAAHVFNDLAEGREGKSGQPSDAIRSRASNRSIEDAEGKRGPVGATNCTSDFTKLPTSNVKLTVKGNLGHCILDGLRGGENVSVAGHELGARPHGAPAIELLGHQPTRGISRAVSFREHEHARNIPRNTWKVNNEN